MFHLKQSEIARSSIAGSKPRFRIGRTSALLGIGVVALLALSGFAAACGGGGGSPPKICSVSGKAPAALQISLPVPAKTVPAGSTLAAAFQVEVVNYASGDLGTNLYIPSTWAKFPLNSTSKLSIYFSPRVYNVSGAGWSNVTEKVITLPSSTTFAKGVGGASLTTMSIAVMAQGGLSNLTVAFQWGWTVNVSGKLTSKWSVANTTASHTNLPSIFQPAPYVEVAATSNTTATQGSRFQVELTGAVGSTSFGTAVEYPNGTEIQCNIQKNPRPTNCFVVDVTLSFANWTPLNSGKYLIHVHDQMGAIVHTISITVVNQTGWGWGGWGHSGHTSQLSCPCSGGGGGGGGHGGWGGGGSGCNGYGWCSGRGSGW
jgi:hypothetical protein